MTKTLRVVIHGRVQGVNFRSWTVEQALNLGLCGWVRNRADGTVESVICGSHLALEEMLKAFHRGSEASHVDKVESSETDLTFEVGKFVKLKSV